MLAKRTDRVRRTAATAVETAVISMVCFLFMFALFEFGRFIQMRQMMENAARTGARTAVVIQLSITTPAAATTAVDNAVNYVLAGSNLQNVNITIYQADSTGKNIGAWTSAPFGQNILVKVDADYGMIFPTFNWLPSSGAAANSTHITTVAMMRSEAN
jgi:Flp pilus assembly protein TadG